MKKSPYTLIPVRESELTAFVFFGILVSSLFAVNARFDLEAAHMPFFDSFWGSLIINILSSAGVSIALTVTVYYKFLRRIPEENERRINRLLNDRLAYESADHNAEMAALNPNTAQLSKEHDLIRSDVEFLKLELIKRAARADEGRRLMNDSQREVVNAIRRLDAIPALWSELLTENQRLKATVRTLQTQLSQQNAWGGGLSEAPDDLEL